MSGFEKERSVQDQGYTWAYRALRELLWLRSASQSAIRNSQSVIGPARRALELADEWQKQVGRPNARDYIRAHWLLGAAPDEARRLAEEALVITERSGYVLQGADARLELAKLALARGDKAIALEHAKEARRLATCDGPPDYTYKAAYDEAGALLDELES